MDTALIPTGVKVQYCPPFNGVETAEHARWRLRQAHPDGSVSVWSGR